MWQQFTDKRHKSNFQQPSAIPETERTLSLKILGITIANGWSMSFRARARCHSSVHVHKLCTHWESGEHTV